MLVTGCWSLSVTNIDVVLDVSFLKFNQMVLYLRTSKGWIELVMLYNIIYWWNIMVIDKSAYIEVLLSSSLLTWFHIYIFYDEKRWIWRVWFFKIRAVTIFGFNLRAVPYDYFPSISRLRKSSKPNRVLSVV